MSEFLLIIIGSIILIYIYSAKDKLMNHRKFEEKLVIFLLSFSSIFFWVNTVPQFRFGFSLIIIFTYIFFDSILNLNINFNKKKFIHFLILGLIILNFKNIDRIHSEFERNDSYKFKNFPFYNEKVTKYQ